MDQDFSAYYIFLKLQFIDVEFEQQVIDIEILKAPNTRFALG